MRTEGYKFPAMKESDAMFSADTAPEWADGQCCHRCRVQFTVMQRKVCTDFVNVSYSNIPSLGMTQYNIVRHEITYRA